MQQYQQVLAQANQVGTTPYTPFTGETVAPINAQQQYGINYIDTNADEAQPYIQQAAGMTSQAAQPVGANQINQYLNPFTQDVVQATQAAFANQNAQAATTGCR